MIEHTPRTDVSKLMQRLQTEADRYRVGHSAVFNREEMSAQSFQSDGLGVEEALRSRRSPQEVKIPALVYPASLEQGKQIELLELQSFVDGKCKLRDLLAYQDRAFICAAYWAVFHRAPDEGGGDTYLRLLRGGKSKMDILEFLRRSPEGRKKSAPLRGLWGRLLILKLCKIPIVGVLVRLLHAFWCLPETQRSQRATEGQLHALVEQIQGDAIQSMHAANHALLDLSHGLNELTRYAASKADHESVSSKASSEDMWRLFDEVHSSLQMLQTAKAPSSDVAAIKVNLTEACSTLKLLESSKAPSSDVAEIKANLTEACSTLKLLGSSKAELALVDQAHQHITCALKLKSDRDEVSELIANAFNESSQTSASLLDSKVDRTTFDEMRELLLRAVQAKADRHELTTLTNYLVDLVQARLTKEDIASLELSFEEFSNRARSDQMAFEGTLAEFGASLLEVRDETGAKLEPALVAARDSIAALAQSKADFSALESAHANARLHTDNALSDMHQALATMSANKADRAELEATIESVRETSQIIARSKDDVSALKSAQADARLRTDNSLSDLQQALATMSVNKADQTALEAAIESVRDTAQAIAQSKADLSALESAQAEARLRTDDALKELHETLASMSTNEMDRSALESAIESARDTSQVIAQSKADLSALESSQADAGSRTDNALRELRQALAIMSTNKADRTALEAAIESVRDTSQAIAQSKADLSALESAQADARLRTDSALGELHQAMATMSVNMADRTVLATALGEIRLLIDATRKEAEDAMQSALAPLTRQTRDVKRNVIEQERRLGLLLDEARKRMPKAISTRQIKKMLAEDDHLLDAMYASFEDMFRGTREDIKQRQSIYLPYVHAVQAGVGSAPIVDIGCGRGEWLELLRDEGLEAQGVDLNHIFLQRCRELNLNVVESDAVAFLCEQIPNSLGAVTSFHLIEHLPHKSLIALLDAALRALRPGGLAIFETPNPRNLQVGSCNFYLDPTHRNPLPPDLMRYMFEARGFVSVEIKELHPSPENPITEGAPAVTDVLNRFLFSAQDYAVIGKKP